LATYIVWIMATTPLVFIVLKNHIPASVLGSNTDVLESRLYFWWFGHAVAYFWLLPAITLWYYYVPKALGVPLFSDTMAKVSFSIFILASTPVGTHHQLTDPGINPYVKYLQTLLTLVVATPSMLTAFNIIATLERAGRARGGGGLLGWLLKLPWRDPAFTGLILALIAFGSGGISWIINGSYQLNNVVHNTAWIVGHFHTTVGTAVALSFMAYTYVLLRDLYGRKLILESLSLTVPTQWFIGMTLFSIGYYIAGLYGALGGLVM
ncbi:MAG: cbb3-type cytochrome c oxidase subunit I, partial [Acidilobaceae archaeon]